MERNNMSEVKAGTLYLVPTPIGNLADMTDRAKDILSHVDLIAAEDTRHSRILLDHLGIHTPMVAYHEHNKHESGPELIEKLKDGISLAQLSDAGMPVISDPGADLVRLALAAGIPVVPLPGPNAALTALVASGLDARQFVFIGFLPKTTAKAVKLMEETRNLPFTLIFYEAPHRLRESLKFLLKNLGNRRAVLARELTKKFETFERDTLENLLAKISEEPPRGEYVVLVEGMSEETAALAKESETDWREEAEKLAETMTIKEAARETAKKYHLARREVYQYLIGTAKSEG